MLPQGKSRALVSPLLCWGSFHLHRSMILPQPCPLERQGCPSTNTPFPLHHHLRWHKNRPQNLFESLFLCLFALSLLRLCSPFCVGCDHVAETRQALCHRWLTYGPVQQPDCETSFANQTSTGKLYFMFLISDEVAYIFANSYYSKWLWLQIKCFLSVEWLHRLASNYANWLQASGPKS